MAKKRKVRAARATYYAERKEEMMEGLNDEFISMNNQLATLGLTLREVPGAAYYKERKEEIMDGLNDGFISMNSQLASMGLTLREVPGDGNCLFRSLGDQLEGHVRNHMEHRKDVAQYVLEHREDFEPFIEDNVPFDQHVNNLAEVGTHAGNDAIVAFARLHNVTVVIHQLNAPLWQIHGSGTSKKPTREIHVAYHNGDHYNSVRRLGDTSEVPANIKLSISPLNEKHVSNSSLGSPNHSYSDWLDNDNTWMPNDEELEQLEQEVMDQTGCKDLFMIRQALQDHNYALEATVKSILQLSSVGIENTAEDGPSADSIWSTGGTGTRIFGTDVAQKAKVKESTAERGGAKPKVSAAQDRMQQHQHLANKERKELKKAERKKNNEEQKRRKACGDLDSESDAEDSTILVKDLGFLSI